MFIISVFKFLNLDLIVKLKNAFYELIESFMFSNPKFQRCSSFLLRFSYILVLFGDKVFMVVVALYLYCLPRFSYLLTRLSNVGAVIFSRRAFLVVIHLAIFNNREYYLFCWLNVSLSCKTYFESTKTRHQDHE